MIIIVLRNLICIIGLIVISPILILLACFIFIEDGQPVFFTQERLGINRQIFKIYKIRTMKKNTPQLGTHEVKRHFQLRAGAFARNLKLDEFPQLLNVIKGDINLVGPRPGLLNQNDLEQARIKDRVFKIKPGITGLSQILGFDMSDPINLSKIDKIYIKNYSTKLNILILAGTFFQFPRKYLLSTLNITVKN